MYRRKTSCWCFYAARNYDTCMYLSMSLSKSPLSSVTQSTISAAKSTEPMTQSVEDFTIVNAEKTIRVLEMVHNVIA